MQIVKSVGVMSVAKIMGLVYGCLGLIFAPFFLLIGLLGSVAGGHRTPFAGALGVIFALLMPILYGLMGFLMGAIGGGLYNLFAKLVGGFEVELEVKPDILSAPYPIVPPANPSYTSTS
ncbi:MAG: hypothetical protein WA252_06405 [Candidatus Sulfotelmatobacter sp.]|jgi:hypothetical protein